MKKKSTLEIGSLTLHELVSLINSSKSGKVVLENVQVLASRGKSVIISEQVCLVKQSSSDRSSLLGSRALLNKIAGAFGKRMRKSSVSQAMLDRFALADALILSLLSEWETLYVNDFPIFGAWLASERFRGMDIPDAIKSVSFQQEEASVRQFRFENEKDNLFATVNRVCCELKELLDAFTPSLEEVFQMDEQSGTIDTFVSGPLVESKGMNDDLFQAAREKFNYLTKTLLPKVGVLANEAGNPIAEQCSALKLEVETSPTYLNFVLLLSQRFSGAAKDDDAIYDEWF